MQSCGDRARELLKREYYPYRAKAAPYSGNLRRQILADRIEQIIGNEVGKWADRPAEESRNGSDKGGPAEAASGPASPPNEASPPQ